MTEPMRWRMFGYMAALFVAGAITGAAVMSRTVVNSQSLKVGRTDEILTLIKMHLHDLDLTPQQREKFDPLIHKTAQEFEASHLDCLNRINLAIQNLHQQMLPELTPEQREKLKQLEAQHRDKMRKKYNYPPEGTNGGAAP